MIQNIPKLHPTKVKSVGEIPNARFGHTFTMISKTKAVLFGGAVSENGRFVITNETYLYDFTCNRWKKLDFDSAVVPSERAAHASACISQSQMAVYGGAASGTQGLLKDDLYLLDLKNQPTWRTIEMTNKQITPGQRYGHTMVFSKPFLIIFGGNTGNKAENDVWLFNIQKTPHNWVKYDFGESPQPCPRVYHSAALCEVGSAQGMMVIFGGRKETKKQNGGKDPNVPAMNDIWGLRKHRDGTWDWVFPPKHKTFNPLPRYQHMICFSGTNMIVVGGRTNVPEEATPFIQVYNTETSDWFQYEGISRYRHAVVSFKNTLYVHGGFEPEFANHPLETMVSIDLSGVGVTRQIQNEEPIEERQDRLLMSRGTNQNSRRQLRQIKDERNTVSNNSRIKAMQKTKQRDLTPSRMLASTKNIRLSNQAVIATGQNNNMQIQKVHVNTLLEQSKRLTQTPKLEDKQIAEPELIQCFLSVLLPHNSIPKTVSANMFPFKKQRIIRLCQEVAAILTALPSSVVYVRAPVKVYGCIYGRYHDLLRLFQNFGNPDDHEVETFDYVFLGNYVDKGYNSLDTICLLLALKLKYPEHIVLLRGAHEDAKVNRLFGLAEECAARLGENISDPNSVYNHLNKVFDLLPLVAVIEDRILCVHSGIGNLKSLAEIEAIQRPSQVHKNKCITDILWSNTAADNRDPMGYNPNKTSDVVLNNFLEDNGLMMMIRSRECIFEGYESEGNKISIFSVPNYGKCGGSAAILKITKSLDLAPLVLQPSNTIRSAWINETPLKTNLVYTQQEQQLRKKMFSPVKRK